MSPKSQTVIVILALTALMAVWGGSFIAIKIAVRHISPVQLLLARFIPSAVLLAPMAWLMQRQRQTHIGFWKSLSKREKTALIGASFFAVPAYHFCLNTGSRMIPAGWASLVIALNPASIIIFAALLLREPVGWRRWSGIGLAFAGLVLIAARSQEISTAGAGDATSGDLLTRLAGIAITLGSVISFGAYTSISKRLIRRHPPFITMAWSISLGTAMLLPALNPGFFRTMAEAPAELWMSVLYLSVVCTVAAFAVWFWALNKWEAGRTGAFIYLVPMFALYLSYLMLDEVFNIWLAAGSALVLGGVVLAAGTSRAAVKQQTA